MFSTVLKRGSKLSLAEVMERFAEAVQPFAEQERAEMVERLVRHGYGKSITEGAVDPASWAMPSGPVPVDYLSLMCWSYGGEFQNRGFFLRVWTFEEVRRKTIEHIFPYFLPGLFPFAGDGGLGVFCFNMAVVVSGDEPRIQLHSLSFMHPEYNKVLDGSFLHFCQLRIQPELSPPPRELLRS